MFEISTCRAWKSIIDRTGEENEMTKRAPLSRFGAVLAITFVGQGPVPASFGALTSAPVIAPLEI